MKQRPWSRLRIADLLASGEAEVKTGPFGTQLHASDYVESGTPVINVRNIGFGGIRADKLEYITDETVKRLSGHLLQPGDIVFGRKGAVERHVLIQEEQNKWFQGSDCLRLRLRTPRVLPRFLSYYLLTHGHQLWMAQQCSHGATMASLNQDIVGRIEFSAPNRTTQQAIASTLAAYDDLIENNSRRIGILEAMARCIYEEWFVRFRFPGHEHVPLAESELGLVPEGWRVVPLAEMVDTQYGYTESAQDKPIGPKFLRGMDINKQPYIDWSAVPFCPIEPDELPKFKLAVGDVVVIRMADPGKIGIVEKEIEAVFASYLVRLRIIDPRMTPYFLFYFLTGERYQGYITGVSTGTTRKSASAPVITDVKVVMPTEEWMRKFNEHVVPLRKLLNTLLEKNANLRITRDLLLPKLISGELDVSMLPNPEALAA